MNINSNKSHLNRKLKSILTKFSTIFFKSSVIDLRNSTFFHESAIPCSLASEIFEKIKVIPGWFNFDDCTHFHLILRLQSLLGIRGNFLEIGSYHGRSTALMCRYLRNGEKIVVCDAFESQTKDNYANKPSPEALINNILRLNPTLDQSKVLICHCLSSKLSLEKFMKFRFIHLDGGHSKDQVLNDLHLSKGQLINKGIIAIDDYQNKEWPEVTAAVNEFMSKNSDFSILADFNRHGAKGRKLYIIFSKDHIHEY